MAGPAGCANLPGAAGSDRSGRRTRALQQATHAAPGHEPRARQVHDQMRRDSRELCPQLGLEQRDGEQVDLSDHCHDAYVRPRMTRVDSE
jgi:hypothetical protein